MGKTTDTPKDTPGQDTDRVYQITGSQVGDIQDLCFKTHALAIVLQADRIGKEDKSLIEDWLSQGTSCVLSRLASILQDQMDRLLDVTYQVESQKVAVERQKAGEVTPCQG